MLTFWLGFWVGIGFHQFVTVWYEAKPYQRPLRSEPMTINEHDAIGYGIDPWTNDGVTRVAGKGARSLRTPCRSLISPEEAQRRWGLTRVAGNGARS